MRWISQDRHGTIQIKFDKSNHNISYLRRFRLNGAVENWTAYTQEDRKGDLKGHLICDSYGGVVTKKFKILRKSDNSLMIDTEFLNDLAHLPSARLRPA